MSARLRGSAAFAIAAGLLLAPRIGSSSDLSIEELTTLRYTESRTGDRVKITPTLRYRDLYAAGGPVPGLNKAGSPFTWDFPSISFKYANNTDKTVMLTEAVFATNDTRPRNDVLLIWEEDSVAQLAMRNEGWGSVRDAKLLLDFADNAACADWPSSTRYAREVGVADFSERITVPVLDYLPSRLRTEQSVCVFGQIRYRERETERTVKFKTRVVLQVRATSGMPPSNFYDVWLHAGVPSETVVRSLEQKIASGDTDHFVIRVASDQSALFDTTISLGANGGAIVDRRRIELDIFVPRSQAKRATRAQQH